MFPNFNNTSIFEGVKISKVAGATSQLKTYLLYVCIGTKGQGIDVIAHLPSCQF